MQRCIPGLIEVHRVRPLAFFLYLAAGQQFVDSVVFQPAQQLFSLFVDHIFALYDLLRIVAFVSLFDPVGRPPRFSQRGQAEIPRVDPIDVSALGFLHVVDFAEEVALEIVDHFAEFLADEVAHSILSGQFAEPLGIFDVGADGLDLFLHFGTDRPLKPVSHVYPCLEDEGFEL